MRYLFGTLVALFAAVALALGFPPTRDVVTTIHIAAPPARVWAVLTDTARYPAWNPGMVLKGALIPGHVIEHDEGKMVFHPTIMAATPNQELAWLGHIGPPRLFDALHVFRLAPEGDGTRFTQSEHIRGVLLWLYDASQLVPKFEAMNNRLKTAAEKPGTPAAP
jgi:hypothetical protein